MESNQPSQGQKKVASKSSHPREVWTRERAQAAVDRVVQMQADGEMGESEVLEKPVKGVDGKWYTARDFVEKFGR